MLLFTLKKCAFRVRMCHLVTHNICNQNFTKMRGLHYWREPKYMYLKKPNIVVYKQFSNVSTNAASEKIPIPRLMWCSSADFTLFAIILFYWPIRLYIDPSFRVFEFLKGAGQAINVISNALATQNYDILENMVEKRTLKLLKRRIDILPEQQRKLLAIDISKNYPFPAFFIYNINPRESKDEREKTLDVTVAGWQKRNDYVEDKLRMIEEGPLKHMGRNTLTYIYVFRRKYVNDTAGPWMVKLISYGNMNTYLAQRL